MPSDDKIRAWFDEGIIRVNNEVKWNWFAFHCDQWLGPPFNKNAMDIAVAIGDKTHSGVSRWLGRERPIPGDRVPLLTIRFVEEQVRDPRFRFRPYTADTAVISTAGYHHAVRSCASGLVRRPKDLGPLGVRALMHWESSAGAALNGESDTSRRELAAREIIRRAIADCDRFGLEVVGRNTWPLESAADFGVLLATYGTAWKRVVEVVGRSWGGDGSESCFWLPRPAGSSVTIGTRRVEVRPDTFPIGSKPALQARPTPAIIAWLEDVEDARIASELCTPEYQRLRAVARERVIQFAARLNNLSPDQAVDGGDSLADSVLRLLDAERNPLQVSLEHDPAALWPKLIEWAVRKYARRAVRAGHDLQSREWREFLREMSPDEVAVDLTANCRELAEELEYGKRRIFAGVLAGRQLDQIAADLNEGRIGVVRDIVDLFRTLVQSKSRAVLLPVGA